jgi:hypothetical protein
MLGKGAPGVSLAIGTVAVPHTLAQIRRPGSFCLLTAARSADVGL